MSTEEASPSEKGKKKAKENMKCAFSLALSPSPSLLVLSLSGSHYPLGAGTHKQVSWENPTSSQSVQ